MQPPWLGSPARNLILFGGLSQPLSGERESPGPALSLSLGEIPSHAKDLRASCWGKTRAV